MSRSLARFFDIPNDGVSNVPRITVTDGRSILAENCGALTDYSCECIRFACGVAIQGAELKIDMMNRDEVRISGLVGSIDWE